MRILQVNNYAYLKGGSEKVFFVTTELLRKAGHEVFYFSVGDVRNQLGEAGFEVDIKDYNQCHGLKEKLIAAKDFVYNIHVARNLEAYIKEVRPEIAHLHIFYGRLTSAVIRILKKNQIPIVQSVHEYRLLCPVYTCLDPHFNNCEKCANQLFKLSCLIKRCSKGSLFASMLVSLECLVRDMFFNNQKNIDAFIMVSKFIQEKHLSHFPLMKGKCYQIYNSVDTAFYRKYALPVSSKKDIYYLYVGRLSYEKGIYTLLEAFRHFPEGKLKIVGTGALFADIEHMIDEFHLSNVELHGFKSGEELYRLIAGAYFTIIPSEWYENNPLSVIESLSLGTPVIGSNIGGIPELVIENNTGFLYTPKDQNSLSLALRRAEELSLEEYSNLCKYSMKFAETELDNTIYYKKLMDVYMQILRSSKPALKD